MRADFYPEIRIMPWILLHKAIYALCALVHKVIYALRAFSQGYFRASRALSQGCLSRVFPILCYRLFDNVERFVVDHWSVSVQGWSIKYFGPKIRILWVQSPYLACLSYVPSRLSPFWPFCGRPLVSKCPGVIDITFQTSDSNF